VPDDGGEPSDGEDADSRSAHSEDADAEDEDADDETDAEPDADDGGSDVIAGAGEDTDLDDIEFDFG